MHGCCTRGCRAEQAAGTRCGASPRNSLAEPSGHPCLHPCLHPCAPVRTRDLSWRAHRVGCLFRELNWTGEVSSCMIRSISSTASASASHTVSSRLADLRQPEHLPASIPVVIPPHHVLLHHLRRPLHPFHPLSSIHTLVPPFSNSTAAAAPPANIASLPSTTMHVNRPTSTFLALTPAKRIRCTRRGRTLRSRPTRNPH